MKKIRNKKYKKNKQWLFFLLNIIMKIKLQFRSRSKLTS